MILINQIKCNIDHPIENIKELIVNKLKCKRSDIISYKVVKESIDARKDLHIVYSCIVEVKNETKYLTNKDITIYQEYDFEVLKAKDINYKPIVVGFGPCGMFAALTLAKAGLKPIIFERGSKVEKRIIDVEKFWNDGLLNTESNVQFGEGGAGTFSDGKLTTRIKDIKVKEVIKTFIEMGANPEIEYKQHPHIGTDELRKIVTNIRNKIIELGGEFHFDSKVESLIIENNQCKGVIINNQEYKSDFVILAIGHSAHDTLINLDNQKVFIEPKDFAIGVRVEHPQVLIDKNQFKNHYNNPKLKSSEYRLTYTSQDNRGVYSFCMCPGGYVIASNDSSNRIVTNGMSESKRDNDYANSAILVQVRKSDFYNNSIKDGMNYQKSIEEKAFILGGSNYFAPCMNIEDYMNNELNDLKFTPTYTPGVKNTNIHSLFDDFINKALKEAFIDFDKKIPGFITQGIMIAPETRSSSVARITRNESLESINTKNLYPSGEGAGYSGGIVSSAIDGIRCAQAIITKINMK